MKIKVCGMLHETNIGEVAGLKPDFMGFIFYPKSPRYVVGKLKADVTASLPRSIIACGVFVNDTLETIVEHTKNYHLTAVQLHGDESPQMCDNLRELGFIVIKAFRIDENFDFSTVEPYEGFCDYFLFDTKTSAYGGSGEKFNWQILNKYQGETPVVLSGGIGLKDVEAVKALSDKVFAVDINSKFESEPGLKKVDELRQFFKKIRKDQPKWDF